MEPICDAHLDLAMNAISFDRDLTTALGDINALETNMTDHAGRGQSVVSFPAMREGGVGLGLGTVLARANYRARPAGGFRRVDYDHPTRDAASSTASGQIAYYRMLDARNEIRVIETSSNLAEHWKSWGEVASWPTLSVGIVLAMEGADPILSPTDAERWWDAGLRVASLVHFGRNEYADGTGTEGPITELGRELLLEFSRLGMILDVTHLSDNGFFDALERYPGAIFASHNNCRELVPGQRQLSDAQIRLVAERGGVVCVALDASMLHPQWVRGRGDPRLVSFRDVANQIEHIVSVTGSYESVAIGSDLDGGFGSEQTPGDCKTISDLQKLPSHLRDRGLGDVEIRNIMSDNLIGFLRRNLPS